MEKLTYNGALIRDRDEKLCLTDMWKAAGSADAKRPANWARKEGAKFIRFLADTVNMAESHIIQAERGRYGGTWGHWQIGLAYAKYLSPPFHAWANEVVRQHMEGAPAGFDERVLAAYLAPFKAAIAALSERIDGLFLAGDPRLHAVPDRMTVREALDRAGTEQVADVGMLPLDHLGQAPAEGFSAAPHAQADSSQLPADLLVQLCLLTRQHAQPADRRDDLLAFVATFVTANDDVHVFRVALDAGWAQKVRA
jgi:KilA-N domain